jgi:hypothetical protein
MPEIASDTGFPIKIDVFSQFADLLGKVGNNLATLATGIKEATETGRALYRSWRDESRMERLVMLRRDLVIHNNKNNQELLRRINIFLDDPSGSNWELVRQHLDITVSPLLIKLIGAVEHEEGAWALEPSYKDLVEVLQTRAGTVIELKSLDAPSTAQEMEGLRRLTVRYQEIMTQLDTVSNALAAYIKYREDSSPTKSQPSAHSRNRPSGTG